MLGPHPEIFKLNSVLTPEKKTDQDRFGQKKKVLILSLALALASALAAGLAGRLGWALGILAGSGVGMINFYFLWHGFERAYDFAHEEKGGEAEKAARREWRPETLVGKFFARYLFLAAAFFLAFKSPWLSFLGFIGGFFLVHLVLGLNTFWRFVRAQQ